MSTTLRVSELRIELDSWCDPLGATMSPGGAGEWPYACAHVLVDEARGLAVASTGGGGGAATFLPTSQVDAAMQSALVTIAPQTTLPGFFDAVRGALGMLEAKNRRYANATVQAVAMLVRGETMCLSAIGLCRAYRVRTGVVEQLTPDESLLTDHERATGRVLTAAEVADFPYADIATGVLGALPRSRDYTVLEARPRGGDIYVLCTAAVWRAKGMLERLASHDVRAPIEGTARTLRGEEPSDPQAAAIVLRVS